MSMESNRISIARVLELGVQLSWREAAAIVYEATLHTGPTRAARPPHVPAESCLLTRGGEVVLLGDAARARPETVIRLLEVLLPACDTPGGLGAAFERGTALAFLEDLAQRTTAKRRRIEIATVAIRGLGAEADLARAGGDAFSEPDQDEGRGDAFTVPPLPADITPRFAPVAPAARVPALEPPAPPPHGLPAHGLPPHAPSPHAATVPMPPMSPRLSTATAPALDEMELPAHAATRVQDFESWRATLKLRDTRVRWPALAAVQGALRKVDRRQALAASFAAVLVMVWWLWPAGPVQVPASPQNHPDGIAAVELKPGWADLDRLGRRTATPAAAPAGSPRNPSPPPPAAARAPAPAPAAPPAPAPARSSGTRAATATRAAPTGASPAPPVIVAAPPPASIPTAATSPPAPVTAATNGDAAARPAARPPVTAPPAALPAPTAATAAPTAASRADESARDTVYSGTNQGVEPPVFRYPAMPAWAVPDPGSTISGPYLEVLVDPQGQVETVRIRGRIEPGETFYRHSMMLASAKLWQFRPARLNGQPVRYVVRVLIEQPQQ
jgi:hypothetical protein